MEVQQEGGRGPEGRAHPIKTLQAARAQAWGDFTEGFPKGVTPRLRHQGEMKTQQRPLQKEQRLSGKGKQNE